VHLLGEAAVQPAADLAVLALDVLAYDDEVHLTGPTARKGLSTPWKARIGRRLTY
jgi:hypothetical protein